MVARQAESKRACAATTVLDEIPGCGYLYIAWHSARKTRKRRRLPFRTSAAALPSQGDDQTNPRLETNPKRLVPGNKPARCASHAPAPPCAGATGGRMATAQGSMGEGVGRRRRPRQRALWRASARETTVTDRSKCTMTAFDNFWY